jgi:hypothetical protein
MIRRYLGLGSIGVVAAAAGAYFWIAHPSSPSDTELWALFDKYCTECHNRDDYTAELAFEQMSVESITHEPEVFEAVVRKLRGAAMPPPGFPKPDPEVRKTPRRKRRIRVTSRCIV